MRRLLWIVPFVLLTASCAIGQEISPSAPPPPAETKPAKVMVYTMGPGVTAPELLPLDPISIPDGKCKNMGNRTTHFVTYIDATGVPCNVTLQRSVESERKEMALDEVDRAALQEVDGMALDIVAADRFKPGTFNGAPVAVAETVEVTLHTCFEEKTNKSGGTNALIRLGSQPEQKFAPLEKSPIEVALSPGAISPSKTIKGVSPPVVLNTVNVEYSNEARRARYQGIVVVSIIVDAQGMPQNPRVVRALGMGLDEKAIEAVKKYRFKPAMKDGKPVAVPVNIEINFRLYDHPPKINSR